MSPQHILASQPVVTFTALSPHLGHGPASSARPAWPSTLCGHCPFLLQLHSPHTDRGRHTPVLPSLTLEGGPERHPQEDLLLFSEDG